MKKAAPSSAVRRPTPEERQRERYRRQSDAQSSTHSETSSRSRNGRGGGRSGASPPSGSGQETVEERIQRKMGLPVNSTTTERSAQNRGVGGGRSYNNSRQDPGGARSIAIASAAAASSTGSDNMGHTVTPDERLAAKMRNDSVRARSSLTSFTSDQSGQSQGTNGDGGSNASQKYAKFLRSGTTSGESLGQSISPDDRLHAKMRGDSQAIGMTASAPSTRENLGQSITPDERLHAKMRGDSQAVRSKSPRSAKESFGQSETPDDRLHAKMRTDSQAIVAASAPSTREGLGQPATVTPDERLHAKARMDSDARSMGVGVTRSVPLSTLGSVPEPPPEAVPGPLSEPLPGYNGSGEGETSPAEEAGDRLSYDGADDIYDAEVTMFEDRVEGNKGEAFCGLAPKHRKCLAIAALLGIVIAAIVGAMAGTGAFNSSDDTKAVSDDDPDDEVGPMLRPTASPTAYVPIECKQSKLLPREDTTTGDFFGRSVAVDGGTAIVGADAGDLSDVDNISSGSVYIYTFDTTDNGPEWKEQARLRSNDNLKGNQLGRSIDVDGDTAVFGALDMDGTDFEDHLGKGCAFVFKRTGTTWEQQAKIRPEDPSEVGVAFGSTVAVYGDTILVGSDFSDSISSSGVNSGSVYVFTRSGDLWTQQAKIVPSDGQDNDRFGRSVALYDNIAVIGAARADANGDNSGVAYVFFRSGGQWTEQAKLLPDDGAANDAFGTSVGVQGDTIVVGADSDDDIYYNSGSVYVFVRRSRTTWTQQAKLVANDASDSFGRSVALDGDTIVVGSRSGAAYVFGRMGTAWTLQRNLLPTLHGADDGGGDEKYGESVDLSGGTVIISAHSDDFFGGEIGSAYTIRLC